jgi:hypothetical protein
MDLSFQQIVIIIAVVLLIVTLTVIGYMMNSIEKLKPWPPSSNQCPDGWTYNITSKTCGSTGINVGSMITDISCGLAGSLTMSGSRQCATQYPAPLFTNNDKCINGWVQGNASNLRDISSCYMLANSVNTPSGYVPDLRYKSSSNMQDNIDWANAFDISWDGLS